MGVSDPSSPPSDKRACRCGDERTIWACCSSAQSVTGVDEAVPDGADIDPADWVAEMGVNVNSVLELEEDIIDVEFVEVLIESFVGSKILRTFRLQLAQAKHGISIYKARFLRYNNGER